VCTHPTHLVCLRQWGGHKNGACKDELIRIPGLSDRSVKVDCTRPPAGLGILQEVEALNVSAVDSIHWL